MQNKNKNILRKGLTIIWVSASLFASYISYNFYQSKKESQIYVNAYNRLTYLYNKGDLKKDRLGYIRTPFYIGKNKNNEDMLFNLSASTDPPTIGFTSQGKNLEFVVGASKNLGDGNLNTLVLSEQEGIALYQDKDIGKNMTKEGLTSIEKHFKYTLRTYLNRNYKKYKDFNPDIEFDFKERKENREGTEKDLDNRIKHKNLKNFKKTKKY